MPNVLIPGHFQLFHTSGHPESVLQLSTMQLTPLAKCTRHWHVLHTSGHPVFCNTTSRVNIYTAVRRGYQSPGERSMLCHRVDTGTAASHAASCVVWTLHTFVSQSCMCHTNICTETGRHEPACGALGCSFAQMQHHTAHTCKDEHLQPHRTH